MSTTTDQLTKTFGSILNSINATLLRLETTTDSTEKTALAAVIKSLAESQKLLIESLDIDFDQSFNFDDPDFDDDYFDDNDDELNSLLDTKQIQFTRKDGKKKKGKKSKDEKDKPADDDLPF